MEVGSGVSSTYVGLGVSTSSVGKGVGRRTPGVGARVLFVPAFAKEKMLDARRILIAEFIVDGGLTGR